jgi:hypothetical protein
MLEKFAPTTVWNILFLSDDGYAAQNFNPRHGRADGLVGKRSGWQRLSSEECPVLGGISFWSGSTRDDFPKLRCALIAFNNNVDSLYGDIISPHRKPIHDFTPRYQPKIRAV